MRKLYIIFMLLGMLLVTSCSDWLDVAPSNQVNDDKMFSNGDGYRNALNGVYSKMSTESMYGREMSWGLIDVVGQTYVKSRMKTTSTYRKAAEYAYDDSDVKSIISNIWSDSYKDIAFCNNLIAHVAVADPSTFVEGEYEKNLIWGEALGLRALLHFDILRMFAPSMATDDKKSYIPYVDTYPVTSTTYEPNEVILGKIKTDLLKAKELMAVCDTVESPKSWMTTSYRMLGQGTTNDMPSDVFFAYRGFRMNYYAVTALLARVYRWEGNYEAAFKSAKEVVEAIDGDSNNYFDFTKSTELESNLKDYNSIIMALSFNDLTERYSSYITSGESVLFIIDAETVFENLKEDARGDALLGDLNGSKYSLKNTIKVGNNGSDMIPMIRLSEMYYVMGEYYARNSDLKKAAEMLQVVRSARGIIQQTLSLGSWEDFQSELLKEVRKELLGEGQLYFEYKRLNQKPVTGAKFVFDRPENEDV
ncbi:RagB/SusD family nutrient uptake outer membrane protein [Bacteroides thetaiotaomicron]|uniref:RagB/SusD family nutrient uptake outer membrane protein n=1 Tax=Bacteroides thetaiotaomicron TaxID=818 RepID=UPI0015AB9A56